MGNTVHTVRSNKINLAVNVEHILQCTRHGKVVLMFHSPNVRPPAFIETLVELIANNFVLVEHWRRCSRRFLFGINKGIAQNGLLLDIGWDQNHRTQCVLNCCGHGTVPPTGLFH